MSIVVTEDRGAVRHVVLNRPEKRNAMNQELLLALGAALRAAAADVDVHCVVLRGEGPVFSAGVDLGELAESAGTGRDAAPLSPGLPRLREPLRRDGQAGRLPDPPHLRRRRARGRARLRSAYRLQRRPARPARGQVRDHPRRRRLDPPAGCRRARSRQGADHDRRADRRRRGASASGCVNRVVAPEELERPPRRSSRSCSPTRTSRSAAPSA